MVSKLGIFMDAGQVIKYIFLKLNTSINRSVERLKVYLCTNTNRIFFPTKSLLQVVYPAETHAPITPA